MKWFDIEVQLRLYGLVRPNWEVIMLGKARVLQIYQRRLYFILP